MRQRAAALALLAGGLVAGRAEPGADVPFAVAGTAAPELHPAASTHPATITITRAVLIVIMTAIDAIRLRCGACQLSTGRMTSLEPDGRAVRQALEHASARAAGLVRGGRQLDWLVPGLEWTKAQLIAHLCAMPLMH